MNVEINKHKKQLILIAISSSLIQFFDYCNTRCSIGNIVINQTIVNILMLSEKVLCISVDFKKPIFKNRMDTNNNKTNHQILLHNDENDILNELVNSELLLKYQF
jgi:hypothetical protein